MRPHDEIIYSICIGDLHDVAQQEFDRDLSEDEVEFIAKELGERMFWYDLIEDLILEFHSTGEDVRKGDFIN